jgi:(R,R)-butanediol dehydrogenase/meso-butanediol dehydrogenase/diacetyl reductase
VRAIEIAADRSLVVGERALTPPGEGEVVLAVALCGICGSDIHMRPERAPVGTVMGHELSGTITEVGPGVEGWAAGQRVVVNPFDPCGDCAECDRGDRHLCRNPDGRAIGLRTAPGGYADFVTVQPHQLFAIPDAVSDAAGALVEPLAVGVHGVLLAGELPLREPVAVFGAGPIGLMTLLALQANGARQVVLVERNPARGARVGDIAGVEAITPEEVAAGGLAERLGGPPGVVFDCAGHASVMPVALEQVRPGGLVVMIGIADDAMPVAPMVLATKELTIRGALAYRTEDIERAIALLADGRVPVERVVTSTVGFDRAEAMFQELVRPGTDEIKVLLSPAL